MPTVGWLRTVLVLLAGVMLAVGSFAIAWAGLFRSTQPKLALSVAPWDAGARISLAGQVMLADPSPVGISQAYTIAMEAAKRQVLSAANIRTLGVIIDARGNRERALRVLLASEQLSRRDLLAQLWLIEHFSGTDSVTRVLVHYDRALTASHDSLPVLFPVLIAASADSDLATPLVRFLSQSRARSWYRPLISEMATKSASPAATGRVVGAVLTPNDPDDRSIFLALIERNISIGKIDDAFMLYAKATRNSSDLRRAASLRDGGFPEAATYPPFDWQHSETGSLVTERRSRADSAGNALYVSGDDIGDGVAARQLVRLASGTYQVSFETGAGAAGSFGVAVACADQGAPASWIKVDMQIGRPKSESTGRFAAIAGCTWHWVALRVAPGTLVSGQEQWISSVKLVAAYDEGDR